MDRFAVANCCLGLLGLLLLQGVISSEGRSIFTSGNQVFNLKDDPEIQRKILSILFHKTLAPMEREDLLGMELGNKLADLEELRTMWEDLELERKISTNVAEEKSITTKRGEPCFWKYCV
uniref:Urotensin 2B n=1 Tax=Cyprinodon variegatus TaxID=28743 RepID=A0A3Q2DEM3_CYPVA